MSPCSISPDVRPLIKRAICALSSNNQIYAAAGVKLYICPEKHSAWNDCNLVGALVLHRQCDSNNTAFLSIVALDSSSGKIMWQHEIYEAMQLFLHRDSDYFAYFVSDKFLFGFLFTSSTECNEFIEIYKRRIFNSPLESLVSSDYPTIDSSNATSSIEKTGECQINEHFKPSTDKSKESAEHLKLKTDKDKQSAEHFNSVTDSKNEKSKSSASTKKGKKKLTRDDIGNPTNLKHLAHIGFDAEKGFDLQNIPPEWQLLFEKAGVTRQQLENKETAKFIVEFVDKKGGPPPIPPRSRGNTAAAQEHKQFNAPLPPPPVPVRSQPIVNSPDKTAVNEPSCPPNLVINNCKTGNENIFISSDSTNISNSDSRSSLMENIRKSGIGILKKAPSATSTVKEASSESTDMASLLALALANRQQKLTECSDEENSD